MFPWLQSVRMGDQMRKECGGTDQMIAGSARSVRRAEISIICIVLVRFISPPLDQGFAGLLSPRNPPRLSWDGRMR